MEDGQTCDLKFKFRYFIIKKPNKHGNILISFQMLYKRVKDVFQKNIFYKNKKILNCYIFKFSKSRYFIASNLKYPKYKFKI